MLRTVAVGVLLVLTSLCSMQAQSAPTAPVPSQISAAKKVFVANGGQEMDSRTRTTLDVYSGGQDRAYNQFYDALKTWGKYELVAAPADADLVLEIRLAGDGNLHLTVLDPKTHVGLWTFNQFVEFAALKGNRDKNFDHAVQSIVSDLKGLVARP